MGIATPAQPAIFFCALTYGEAGVAEAAGAELHNILGAAASDMAPFRFSFTNYYEEEMGTGLWKTVRIFSAPRDPFDLADIKVQTNAIEAALAAPGGKRRVNLDPGYLTLAKVVLATTKDFSHRIYLRGGVYAEVTLSARDGAFQPHPWTYPDYKQESVRQFFWKARNLLAVARTEK